MKKNMKLLNLMAMEKKVKSTYSLRDTGPGGGIVFYVTDGGLHGMEVAPASTEWSGKTWGQDYDTVAGTFGTAIGTGLQNTTNINNAYGSTAYGGVVCDNLTSGGKSDWYMPTVDELKEIYDEVKAYSMGGFTGARYWSSAQYNDSYARFVNMSDNSSGYTGKSTSYRVRAIRNF